VIDIGSLDSSKDLTFVIGASCFPPRKGALHVGRCYGAMSKEGLCMVRPADTNSFHRAASGHRALIVAKP
jgi:hypothetical protein